MSELIGRNNYRTSEGCEAETGLAVNPLERRPIFNNLPDLGALPNHAVHRKRQTPNGDRHEQER
jgi:hypothetical protein